MRTTLDLDETVLRVARARAAQSGISLGRAVSELALRGLHAVEPRTPVDFPLLPDFGGEHVVTDDLVAEHRDDAV